MKMHLLALLAWLAVTVAAHGAEFTPVVGWEGQIYPSFVISSARMKNPGWVDQDRTDTLGDKGGLIGVRLKSPRTKTPIKVTITCDDIMEPSTFSGTLPEANVEYLVLPAIRYRYAKLAEFNQATPVSMTFRVQVGTASPQEETATATVRSINDCPFAVQEGERSLDIACVFAAYVNEQHPFIDKLLREALDGGVVAAFTGYQQDEAEVVRQVYALWDLLVERDVRYSSITATAVDSESVWCQHVRLIEESLNNSQANCVDGSVLFASLLRKIGIEPFLVLVPGHCYVGFYLDAERQHPIALETTLLGAVVDEDEQDEAPEFLEDAVDEDRRGEISWPSFCLAVATGMANFEEHEAEFAAADATEYVVIEIAAARKAGIMPIAYRGREKFVALVRAPADDGDDDETADADE
jgi:hypothetical protein